MTEDHLVSLIIRQLSGKLEPGEVQELAKWADEDPVNNEFLKRFATEALLKSEIEQWKRIDPAVGYRKWQLFRHARKSSRMRQITAWSVAASVLIATALIWLTRKAVPVDVPARSTLASGSSVLPGRNTAILVLSNGREIMLDSASKGELTTQGGAKLIKLDSGSLSYSTNGTAGETEVAYNTLVTPRSGQYLVVLPDGSRVWMNNVSKLRYPTSFPGKERRVELTGEAYFEIAKVRDKPFIVKLKDEEVQVLGTSFNINAYEDETVTLTTLLTGAVRVRAGHSAVVLRPDEQALRSENGSLTVLRNIPSEDIVSWKKGFFYFGKAPLTEIMRQLARWYDIDVKYAGNVPDLEFEGKIDRSLPLDELLKFLNRNQVKFRLEGRTVIVLPS
jgi:transmembrane sensor